MYLFTCLNIIYDWGINTSSSNVKSSYEIILSVLAKVTFGKLCQTLQYSLDIFLRRVGKNCWAKNLNYFYSWQDFHYMKRASKLSVIFLLIILDWRSSNVKAKLYLSPKWFRTIVTKASQLLIETWNLPNKKPFIKSF